MALQQRKTAATDSRDVPAYTLAEAARYLRLPDATLRSWVLGREYPTADGSGQFPPLIKPASRQPPLLSFSNLIEAHVLRSLRTDHAVSVKDLRSALAYAEQRLSDIADPTARAVLSSVVGRASPADRRPLMHTPRRQQTISTSVAIEALLAGGRDQDRPVLERARAFLLAAQSDEGEGYEPGKDPHYGGIGYGGDERPDLSNTQMALEAAALAGASREDPFFAKARLYLQRCQNFAEDGVQRWPRAAGGQLVTGNDGGATYMPGNSFAGEVPVGDGLWQARSYGSMSYALAKSYVLCGAAPDDDRLAAVVRWLARHFTVDSNPGYADPRDGAQGLFYYWLVMARTLRLLPEGAFTDEAGQPIAWRAALGRKLLDTQRSDGSWINEASPRWWEGAPPLATAYAVLTLKAIHEP